MTTVRKPKKTIGRAEPVTFPGVTDAPVYARIDSGARTSAIWVSHAVIEDDGRLGVIFFGPENPLYDGTVHHFTAFSRDIVTNSTGDRSMRFKIRLSIVLRGRRIRANFTLADRSTQVYPVLIGRNVLRGKFVVDVSLGHPLREEERALERKNQKELAQEDAE